MDYKKCFGFFVVLAGIVVGYVYHLTSQHVPVPPELREDGFFGRSVAPIKDDETIRPFTVNVPDEVLIDLKDRLKKHRPQESFEGTNFEYGFRSDQLKKVIDYWTNKYDWRKEEKFLNQYPHFKTQIEGIDIHFMHIKSAGDKKRTTPLLLVHGWPGSVVEFLSMIPLLTNDFELVIPSIPGYGFSEAAHKPGLNHHAVGRIFVKLMKRLKHEKFLYHGGDWGAIIGKSIAVVYPETLIGYHTTMSVTPNGLCNTFKALIAEFGFPGLVWDNPDIDAKKMNPMGEHFSFLIKEMGYAHIQATKPDTVGVALNNDPAGLAAYILEKFSTWTNKEFRNLPDGGLTKKFTLDQLLTNVMLYWVNGCITSSQRFYKETMGASLGERYTVTVPTGHVSAANELMRHPLAFMKGWYTNITQYTDVEDGGHFLAMEKPKFLAENIKSFAAKLGVRLS
jgi:microsomal epoxide hydrolase